MLKKLSLTLLTLAFTLTLPLTSQAETVMEKVKRTGVLTVGTSTDLIPLSYVNDKGKLVGYTVDVLEVLRQKLTKELGKEITLEFVQVPVKENIPKLMNGELDIVCNTAFTWQRDQFIDFSLSMGITGTRILVKRDSNLSSPESLENKRIGVIPGTNSAQVIKVIQPKAILVQIDSIEKGVLALEKGEIDAFAGDGVILEGHRQTISQPDALKVVPKKAYSQEGVACMVPENNSEFLNVLNYTIVRLMQGYVDGEASSVALVNRWFGSDGIITIDPALITDYFKTVILSREQIKITP